MTDEGGAGDDTAGRDTQDSNLTMGGSVAKRVFASVARKVQSTFRGRAGTVALPKSVPVRPWLRDVDRWFVAEICPHERGFLNLARRLTMDAEAARDLVHDAYAEVLVGQKWQTIEHPRAYVRRIIFNLGLNRLKRLKVVPMQQLAKVETVSYADLSPDAFEALSSREELELVLAALRKLPPKARKVVILRRVEGIAPREISERLGISLSTVESHLANGLALLSDLLADAEGGDLMRRSEGRRKRRNRE